MNNLSNTTRVVQFAGNSICFDVASPQILKAIDTHFAHCFGSDENVIADYKIQAGEGANFSILRNGDDFQSNIQFEQVLFQLMQDGLTQLNGAPATHLIFHAAALAYHDRGLLLCGKSGSGKSTLTAQLVANGFQYLTDEVIALPLEGDQISGFCRSLVLKKGSALIWRHLLAKSQDHLKSVSLSDSASSPKEEGSRLLKVRDSLVAKNAPSHRPDVRSGEQHSIFRTGTTTGGLLEFKDGNAWVAPTLFNASAVRREVRPHVLIFPTYKEGVPFQVERLTSANTLFRLMQTLVNARNFPDHGMAVATRLARQVTAFTLTYSDIETATQWIQQTITTQ